MSVADRSSEHIARLFLAGLALFLTASGQLAFLASPQGLGLGLLLSAMGMLIFIGTVISSPPEWAVRGLQRLAPSTRSLLILAAVGLSILATIADRVWVGLGRNNYLPILIAWAAAAGLYIAAFANGPLPAGGWRAWGWTHRWELLGLLLITATGVALRFYQLGSVPRVIDGDEGRLGQAALLAGRGTQANPFALFENFGGLYVQTIGLFLELFGRTPWALRLAPAIGGILAIPSLYLCARYLAGPWVGLVAAALLAWSHAHIHFSRIADVAYIQEAWLIPLELFLFISGLERRSRLRLAASGLVLGAHLSIYVSAQIIVGLVVVYLLIAAWLCRPLVQGATRSLWVMGLGFGVTALPQVTNAVVNPNEFCARLNTDGTFQSGWLTRTMAETGQAAFTILAGRVTHASLTLVYYPAIDFYGARIPLLDFMTATLFVLGLSYALWRTREPKYLLLNGWFWSLTVAIGVFAVPPSADSYRMLVALPATMALAAVGLGQMGGMLLPDQPGHARLRTGLVIFLALAVLLLNVRSYYFDFARRCQFGMDTQTRFASYLGNYLSTVDREAKVYLLSDDIFRYGTHASTDFLSRDLAVTNYPEPANLLTTRSRVVIVSPPTRMDELKLWADQNPAGTFHQEDDCDRPVLLAYVLP
ncbi:MAG: glycosyltransferase family 39 protein [Anaerolineales bacterium]|nr:glycosyltransferase family 39 protein [Anaerolineales bacterium]